MSDTPEMRQHLNSLKVGLAIPVGAIVPRALTAVVSYPLETIYGIGVVNDIFNESMPPTTPHGAFINFGIKLGE